MIEVSTKSTHWSSLPPANLCWCQNITSGSYALHVVLWICCGRAHTVELEPAQRQGCISCGTCSYPELTEDHVLTSAYVKIFRIVTRNAVNKSFWRKKDCSWPPLNKYAMNIWLSSLRIRAHLSWRTGKHLHVLHVLRTYSTCSYPGYQDTTTYAALRPKMSLK